MFYKNDELLEKIKAVKSREEAQTFLAEYKKTNEKAEENIGYITGYLGVDRAEQLIDWFDCPHPIFGRRFPSAEVAFLMGNAIGEAVKNGEHIDSAIKQIKDIYQNNND